MAAVSAAVESWDDDGDFQGDFQAFSNNSTGPGQGSISSRLSVRSESVAGEEDWNVVIPPNDEQATQLARDSASKAGIPLPQNVPTSALLGGTIKRLGKKKSRQRIDDDWDNDIVMSDQPLKLNPRPVELPAGLGEEMDDFDDLEGSLGIRFAGTKRNTRNRSSSVSVMSPSLGSATAESEVDELGGLELPEGPMDFEAILRKRRAADADLSDLSQPSPAIEQPATMNVHKKSKLLSDDNDDFLNDIDLGTTGGLDVRKRTVNKNLKMKSTAPAAPVTRPTTTLNFHDKPTDKPVYNKSHIPRPVSGSKHTSRLEVVLESGAAQPGRDRRHPTTTSAQLLRSKRSMPVLRSQPSSTFSQKPAAPLASTNVSSFQSPHATTQRSMPYHVRRESDPNRHGARSPPIRPSSRLTNQVEPETPSRGPRQRHDMAPPSLAREAAAKRTLTRPARRRNFGDGSELEIFDDLPTSVTKESKFVKQPIARGPPPRTGLRQTQSRSDIREAGKRTFAIPDRMMTPAPRTPSSPTKAFHDAPNATPSYLRDTAASRIARESRLANNSRPRGEGPLQPLSTNWKAQVAARSPHSSPSANRLKARKQPQLITNVGPNLHKNEKGMVYNPHTLRWEGNENMLAQFDDAPMLQSPTPMSHRSQVPHVERTAASSTSPSRPGLIAHIPTGNTPNIQVQNGMVYDPQQMKWLKVRGGRHISGGRLSPSVTDGGDDEEDAFAGIDDLKDEIMAAPLGSASATGGLASPVSLAPGSAGVGDVHEEFDLGPRFIQLQRDEELAWRRRCENWFVNDQSRPDDGQWRRAIRDIIPRDVLDGFIL